MIVDAVLYAAEDSRRDDLGSLRGDLARFALESGGRAIVVRLSPDRSPRAEALIDGFDRASRSRVAQLTASSRWGLAAAVRRLLEKRPGGAVFLHCGVARPAREPADLWLGRTFASAEDRAVGVRLRDPVCGMDLAGFSLEHPLMYPAWRTEACDAPLEALALPLVAAVGRAKPLLADAILSSWPFSYCPLQFNLRCWMSAIRLDCDMDFTLTLDQPCMAAHRLGAPSTLVVLLTERLETWRALWGYETMLMEAARLALVDPWATEQAFAAVTAADGLTERTRPLAAGERSPTALSARIRAAPRSGGARAAMPSGTGAGRASTAAPATRPRRA